MGIYDREYYRGETRGSAWFTGAGTVKAIIIANVLVYILQNTNGEFSTVFRTLGASSVDIFEHGRIWELLTATFVHASIGHLFWNMMFLWMVGSEMEGLYGSRDFLFLYLSAAVISTLGWAAIDYVSDRQGGTMVGASGAVMAVVVLYALFYPHREVLLFLIIPVEMWLVVVIYIGFDAWQLLQGGPGLKTAVASHLTGAAYGYLFKQLDLRWSRLSFARFRRPRLRIVAAEPRERPAPRPSAGPSWSPSPPASPPKPAASAHVPEEQLDARLDEVLAKIAREGRGGLTEEENRVLLEASRRARNKRTDHL